MCLLVLWRNAVRIRSHVFGPGHQSCSGGYDGRSAGQRKSSRRGERREHRIKPGVTIDLSRLNIQYLPDEVVDIIKNELERLVTLRALVVTNMLVC